MKKLILNQILLWKSNAHQFEFKILDLCKALYVKIDCFQNKQGIEIFWSILMDQNEMYENKSFLSKKQIPWSGNGEQGSFIIK